MRQDSDEWLEEKIDEDLMAWADAEERRIMEDEELQNVTMPEEKLEDIHREIRRRRRKTSLFGKTRRRMLIAVAAVMVLLLGMGIVGSTKKLYMPVIMQKERGDEVNTKVENSESTAIDIDEDEVCQEILDKLGVLPVKFKYRPEGMKLISYEVFQDEKEAILEYQFDSSILHVYIQKSSTDTTVAFQMDGDFVENILVDSYGIEIPIYEVMASDQKRGYVAEFEYLNTYYRLTGNIEKEDFIKLIENILIKNE